jgi:hypothetical protein
MLTATRLFPRTCITTLAATALVACTVPRVSTGTVVPPDWSVISPVEIEPVWSQVTTAYDIVSRVRPSMLLVRDRARLQSPRFPEPNDGRNIRVYVDDVSLGGVEMLRNVPKEAVVRVQWLSPMEATTRYGGGHMGGVIAVTTGARP